MYNSLPRSLTTVYYYSKHSQIRTLRRLKTSAERWPPFLYKNQLSWIRISYKQEKDARIKPRPNDRNMSTQHIATLLVGRVCPTCCDMPRVVGSTLNMVQFEPTSNKHVRQHGATGWLNASNNVALTCCDRLAGALESIYINVLRYYISHYLILLFSVSK